LAVCVVDEKLKIPKEYRIISLRIRKGQFKAESHLEGFSAVNKNLFFVPQFGDDMSQKIEILAIAHSNLTAISIKDLKDFPKLLVLDLSWNQIEYLERNLFAMNENLKMIIFHNNKIKKIDHKVFDDLSSLAYLDLTNNICINENKTTESEVIGLIENISEKCKDLMIIDRIDVLENNVQQKIDGKFSANNIMIIIGFILIIFIICLPNLRKSRKISQFFTFFINKFSILYSWASKFFRLKTSETANIENSHTNQSILNDRTACNNTYEELPENSTRTRQTNSSVTEQYSQSVQYEAILYGNQNSSVGIYSMNNNSDNDFYPEIQRKTECEYQSGVSENVAYGVTHEK